MSTSYIVGEDGLRVDHVARRVYGSERLGNAEAVLDFNPGLAGRGEVLARGTALALPERPQPPRRPLPTVNPWD